MVPVKSKLPSRGLQASWPTPDSARELAVLCCLAEHDRVKRGQHHHRSSSYT